MMRNLTRSIFAAGLSLWLINLPAASVSEVAEPAFASLSRAAEDLDRATEFFIADIEAGKASDASHDRLLEAASAQIQALRDAADERPQASLDASLQEERVLKMAQEASDLADGGDPDAFLDAVDEMRTRRTDIMRIMRPDGP